MFKLDRGFNLILLILSSVPSLGCNTQQNKAHKTEATATSDKTSRSKVNTTAEQHFLDSNFYKNIKVDEIKSIRRSRIFYEMYTFVAQSNKVDIKTKPDMIIAQEFEGVLLSPFTLYSKNTFPSFPVVTSNIVILIREITEKIDQISTFIQENQDELKTVLSGTQGSNIAQLVFIEIIDIVYSLYDSFFVQNKSNLIDALLELKELTSGGELPITKGDLECVIPLYCAIVQSLSQEDESYRSLNNADCFYNMISSFKVYASQVIDVIVQFLSDTEFLTSDQIVNLTSKGLGEYISYIVSSYIEKAKSIYITTKEEEGLFKKYCRIVESMCRVIITKSLEFDLE